MFKKFKLGAKNHASHNRKELLGDNRLKKLTMCWKCHSFFYNSSWHFENPLHLENNYEKEINVVFTQCTACLQEEAIFYETDSSMVLG